MLWSYKLNFTGYLETTGSSLAEAHKVLADKMKADPNAFIGSLQPCEPSCSTLSQVFKKALGG